MNINKTILFLIVVVGFISTNSQSHKGILENSSINDVCPIPGTNYFALVSDSGWVYIYDKSGKDTLSSKLLNAEYILTGVCFPETLVGYVVGYKRDEPNKLKGAIWKTINRGRSWFIQIPPSFPTDIPTPFLNVETFNRYIAWITCGNDYKLRTDDGGVNWLISRKK